MIDLRCLGENLFIMLRKENQDPSQDPPNLSLIHWTSTRKFLAKQHHRKFGERNVHVQKVSMGPSWTTAAKMDLVTARAVQRAGMRVPRTTRIPRQLTVKKLTVVNHVTRVANAMAILEKSHTSTVANPVILVANAMVLLSLQKATVQINAKVRAHSVRRYRATQTVKIVDGFYMYIGSIYLIPSEVYDIMT